MDKDLKRDLKKAILESAGSGGDGDKNQTISGNNNVQVGGDFNGNIIKTEKHVEKIIVNAEPGEKHITEAQMLTLRELVHEIVRLEKLTRKAPKGHQAVWSAVNKRGGANKARLIPVENFHKAEKYARQWIGRLSSTKTARKKDTAWRKRKYSFIHINIKKFGLEPRFRKYLLNNFSAESITELSDDDLAKAYNTVSYWKRK